MTDNNYNNERIDERSTDDDDDGDNKNVFQKVQEFIEHMGMQ